MILIFHITLLDGIDIVAFVDDIAIIKIRKNTNALEDSTNNALYMIGKWVDNNGLKVSVSKVVAMTMTSK